MQEIADWLKTLGLSEYAARFSEHRIDFSVLRDLTDQDLKDLDVILGDRRKMLRAIGDLNSTPSAADAHAPALASAPPLVAAATATPTAEAAGERRQLTVMFCDLVGSTALAARLDPEDMGDLIRAFQGAVATTVAHFDGNVAKLMGDGALVYFGYPRAHEDDAERAARASLALVEAVGSLQQERQAALEVRVGIATGLVVVGELMGEGDARERGVVGETPNLAARLQALAEPGSIAVSESTRRLLGGAFELKALGPRTLKGFEFPVPVWSIVRESENVSRFEASRSAVMTPFVGREHEVALLIDRWRDATEGEGQVALLSGEAGIGKSRILAALRERIGDEPHIVMRYQCSPYHVNDAFYPIVGQIWHAAGFLSGEPPIVRLDKLDAMIARSGLESGKIAPYLGLLLSIPTEGRYPSLELDPAEVKERTVAALLELFAVLTRDAPVLAVLEDAHWIDPTALDVFSRLVERLQGLRALLVVTSRPEFVAPWIGRAHVTALSLNRFARRQVIAMIDRVTSGKALPAEVLEQIVAKTDGVPLFVEELTKTVIETGLLREENGSYVLAAALTPFAIPSTLQASLMARLDRLAPVRETVQIGAAIGREFSYRLLEAVSPIKGPALHDALSQLMVAELIYGRGAPPEATYVFKHALVQDAAYASLLRGRRQRIHADIALALAERFVDQIDAAPAVIAHHFTEAGLSEPATRHWLAAAESALSRSANMEADRYVDAGLAIVPRLTEGPERHSRELALLVARANALLLLKGYSAPETVAALTEAKRLLDAGVGTDLQRFSILYGLCIGNIFAAQMPPARALALQFVEVADQQDDTMYRMVGYRLLGLTQLFSGKNREGLESLQQAERFRDPVRQKLLSHRFGLDPGFAIDYCKIMALMFLGLPDRAAHVRERLLAELPSHGHANTVAVCTLHTIAWPELAFGDLEAAERHFAELLLYCAEKKLEYWRLHVDAWHACARATRAPTKENIAALRNAIEAQRESGARITESFFMSQLAEALLRVGDVPGAEAALQETFAFVEQSGETFWLADSYRVQGRIALCKHEPDRAQAEACFLQAVDVARGQQARLLELRAATSMARLWFDQGKRDEARDLLAPVYNWFTEGFDTLDLKEAKALLKELA